MLINPTSELDTFEQTPVGITGLFNDYYVNPQTGLLIVFPSFLKHYMDTQEKNLTRNSLAFNIHPIKVIGNGDSKVDGKWLQ